MQTVICDWGYQAVQGVRFIVVLRASESEISERRGVIL